MTTTSFQRSYTTAVDLNNIGVSLLERRCYAAATETFKDAVSVMKELSTSFRASTSTEESTCPLSPSSVLDSMIRRASQGFSRPSCPPQDGANLCVLTEDESATFVVSALQSTEILSAEATYAIRLELGGRSIQNCGSRGLALQSAAVILHNFGAAHACMATTTKCPIHAHQRYQGAFTLYTLAFSHLHNRCSLEDFQDSEELLVCCNLPLSLLALTSLIRLAILLGKPEEAQVFYLRMVELQEDFLEMEEVLGVATLGTAAAA
jgi:hypothetical protein